jgi:hypothetical protein
MKSIPGCALSNDVRMLCNAVNWESRTGGGMLADDPLAGDRVAGISLLDSFVVTLAKGR